MKIFIRSMVAKTGWQIFTPDNHLTPIFRYKLYDRLAEPGYSNINRFVEAAYPPIKTSIRVAHFHFDEALSRDSIPMEIDLTVLFKFDPRGIDRKVAAQFVLVGDEVFHAIIEDYAHQGLMQLIGRYEAATLQEASIQNRLKNSLFRAVNADVAVLGLNIPALGCITFQRLLPHHRYVRTQLERANLAEKLKQLAFVDERTVDLLFKTDFLHSMEHMNEGSMVWANLDGGGDGRPGVRPNGRFPRSQGPDTPFGASRAEAD